MNLIIDIGNTQYKICLFEKETLVTNLFFNDINEEVISNLLDKYTIEKCIYSDTRGVGSKVFELLGKHNVPVIELSHLTSIPLSIDYETPSTLGKDRIAAAVGAWHLFPNTSILIIDIGTAITIDFVTNNGEYKGGVISPGPETRYRSLYEFTGKLPLLKSNEANHSIYGKNTDEAIHSGVQNGILFEINEYILRYKSEYSNLKVVISGGYSYLFDKKIKYPIFAELFLVPFGLNRILNYNDIR